MGAFAYTFHFQPSELWEFDAIDFEFWIEQLKNIDKAYESKRNNR